MKAQPMLLATLMLTACGTLQTVVRHDDVAIKSLKEQKSYFSAVPRIYSGVAYDFCTLNAPLRSGIDEQDHKTATPVVLIDTLICGALDTLLLPYAVYRQQADGSIIVTE